jgi:hypothetical protein
VLVFERNNAGSKKLSQVLSEQTSVSSAFLNAMCLLKYVLNYGQHFSFFDSDFPTSGLTVTGLAKVYYIYTHTVYRERERERDQVCKGKELGVRIVILQ